LTEDGEFDRCRIFDVDFVSNISNNNNNFKRPLEGTNVTECVEWEYDETMFQVLKEVHI